MAKEKTFLMFLVLSGLLFSYCADNSNENKRNINIFTDSVYQNIYEYQYNSDAKGLIEFLKTNSVSNPEYLKFAATVFANIQDTAAIPLLSEYIIHGDSSVRKEAAFALGQINDSSVAFFLKNIYSKENDVFVKAEILTAIGKTGTEEENFFLTNLFPGKEEPVLLYGQMRGLSKLAEKGISSYKLLPRQIGILQSDEIADSTKFWASYYLFRAKFELIDFENEVVDILKNENNIYVKEQLIKLLRYNKNSIFKDYLLEQIKHDSVDYRITVNAINSLAVYDYSNLHEFVWAVLENKNVHKAMAAADFFYRKGIPEDSEKYLAKARDTENSKVSNIMYAAALRYSLKQKELSKIIQETYISATDIYTKSALLISLKEYAGNYSFIEKEMFASDVYVIKSAAITALNYIRLSESFELYSKEFEKNGENLEIIFADLYKRAILSGDIAMIATAAEMLINPEFEARSMYENTFFIKQAISNCNMPTDLEAYQQLLKLDKYLNGTEYEADFQQKYYRRLNWDSIKIIHPLQKISIVTNKGNIKIELHVNTNPQSVQTFLSLIKQGYYNKKRVHRVVSDFVIQDGCSRGDGWGSPSFIIRSEFTSQQYFEGSVGLASAGKDTESAQWFVTHTNTPHLNGRYSLFGHVAGGQDVVHNIQIGDSIFEILILDTSGT